MLRQFLYLIHPIPDWSVFVFFSSTSNPVSFSTPFSQLPTCVVSFFQLPPGSWARPLELKMMGYTLQWWTLLSWNDPYASSPHGSSTALTSWFPAALQNLSSRNLPLHWTAQYFIYRDWCQLEHVAIGKTTFVLWEQQKLFPLLWNEISKLASALCCRKSIFLSFHLARGDQGLSECPKTSP